MKPFPKITGGFADEHLLSPSFLSTPRGGEGARRAGEEALLRYSPILTGKWYDTSCRSRNNIRNRPEPAQNRLEFLKTRLNYCQSGPAY